MVYTTIASLPASDTFTAIGGRGSHVPGNPVDRATVSLVSSGLSRQEAVLYQLIGYYYLHSGEFTLFTLLKTTGWTISEVRKSLSLLEKLGVLEIDIQSRRMKVHCLPDPDNPQQVQAFAQTPKTSVVLS